MDRPWIAFNTRDGTSRFPALLLSPDTGETPVRSIADYVGLAGFSFRTTRPFCIGECLDCVIALAFTNSSSQLLRAQLVVCRIHLNLHGFRIACRIRESCFVGAGALPAWAAAIDRAPCEEGSTIAPEPDKA